MVGGSEDSVTLALAGAMTKPDSTNGAVSVRVKSALAGTTDQFTDSEAVGEVSVSVKSAFGTVSATLADNATLGAVSVKARLTFGGTMLIEALD
jgi:hypothetical protein